MSKSPFWGDFFQNSSQIALAGAPAGCYNFWAANYAGGSGIDKNGFHDQNEGDVRPVLVKRYEEIQFTSVVDIGSHRLFRSVRLVYRSRFQKLMLSDASTTKDPNLLAGNGRRLELQRSQRS